jgi:hypothetical protein
MPNWGRSAAWATYGHTPESFDNTPNRHLAGFTVGINPPFLWNTVLAHGLGHVLGLMYEHQRYDHKRPLQKRSTSFNEYVLTFPGDSYIRFDCAKIEGYAEAMGRVNQAKKHTMTQVCYDWRLALQYGLAGINLTTMDIYSDGSGQYPLRKEASDGIDKASIMMYPSTAYEGSNWSPHDHLQAPLSYWKKGHPGFQPPEKFERTNLDLIEPNFEVSGGTV